MYYSIRERDARLTAVLEGARGACVYNVSEYVAVRVLLRRALLRIVDKRMLECNMPRDCGCKRGRYTDEWLLKFP